MYSRDPHEECCGIRQSNRSEKVDCPHPWKAACLGRSCVKVYSAINSLDADLRDSSDVAEASVHLASLARLNNDSLS